MRQGLSVAIGGSGGGGGSAIIIIIIVVRRRRRRRRRGAANAKFRSWGEREFLLSHRNLRVVVARGCKRRSIAPAPRATTTTTLTCLHTSILFHLCAGA